VDGAPAPVSEARELGSQVHGVIIDVPRDAASVVRFSLTGTLAPGDRYGLTIVNQPLANPDDVTVRIRAPDGWRPATVAEPLVSDGQVASGSPPAQGTVALDVTFAG
jgi:hypothetical protein